MIAGRSGSAKSSFALWWAARMELRTLYFSADMSPWQASVRLAASQTQQSIEEIEMGLADGSFEPPPALPIHFCFDSSPTLDDLEDELDSYVEAWGLWPEVIVVDNLVNVDSQHDNEYGGQSLVLSWCHGVTRATGAALIILHHTQAAVATKRPYSPQPRWALKNKCDELPELILTSGLNPDTNEYQLSAVKNRSGIQDITGEKCASLLADLPRNRFQQKVGFW